MLFAIPLIACPALAHAQKAIDCPGFSATGSSSIAEVDRFYGERAASILRAAMTRDRAGLALVAPDATVSFWRGDAGWAPRSTDRTQPDLTGAEAVIALADLLKPRGFRMVLDQPGPFVVANPDRCVRNVTVLIAMAEPGQAALLDFGFRDGKLVSVSGNQKGLIEGVLP
jgi:hypothetical protein